MDVGPPQQRAVLAGLLVREGGQVSLGGLVEGVWGDRAPGSAERVIRQYVYRLRLVLGRAGSGGIGSVGGGYVLEVDPGSCDLTCFTRLVARARKARADGDPGAAVALFAEGLALWGGSALAGVPGPYAAAQRARLDELRLDVQEEHAAVLADLGRYDQAAAELSALVTAHPLRERLREVQMLALYRAGRQAEALEVFREASTLLRQELGVDPGPGLTAMHQRILATDPTLLNPAPAQPTPAAPAVPAELVPAQLPGDVAHFTGRAEQVEALTELAERAGSTVVVSAIGGSAGIGKTALVVHWGHRHTASFPDGTLYVNLRGFDPTGTPLEPGAAIRSFLDALGVTSGRIPTGLEAQAGLYRSLLTGKKMLVVLDNARDAEQVRPLLPGAPGTLVLVTSRNQLTGLIAHDGAHSLTLDLLTPHEAHDLLNHRLGTTRAQAEPEAVEELATLCARLPLALNITAARAAMRPDFPLAIFATELRETRNRLSTLDTGDPTANVRAVFSWSYHALSEPAARMFRLLGIHPGPDITTPAAASLTATTHQQARTALNELTSAHLLTEHTPGRYTFHDLLRAYATEQTHTHDTDEQRSQALHRALDHYIHTARRAAQLVDPGRDPIALPEPEPGVTPETLTDDQQAWDWFTAEHQVLLAAITQAETHELDTRVCQLARTLSTVLYRRGHWHDGQTTQTAALAAAERLGDLAEQAHAQRQVARADIAFTDFPKAQGRLELAIELFRRLDDPLDHAHAHGSLALVLDRQGRYREGLDQAQQALPLYREAGDRLGQASTLNTIGWIHSELGEHQQALTYCEEALELQLGLGNKGLQAAIWDSLGHAHHHLGHHKQALRCYHQALDLYRENRERYEEADSLTRLGDTQLAAGDHDDARNTWEQAQTIFEDLQHPQAEDVRGKLKDLAGVDMAWAPRRSSTHGGESAPA